LFAIHIHSRQKPKTVFDKLAAYCSLANTTCKTGRKKISTVVNFSHPHDPRLYCYGQLSREKSDFLIAAAAALDDRDTQKISKNTPIHYSEQA
jgi:hypothetical protein